MNATFYVSYFRSGGSVTLGPSREAVNLVAECDLFFLFTMPRGMTD